MPGTQERRAVSVAEAFWSERQRIEDRISAAAEKIARAINEADRQKFKRLYDMPCEERNWL